MLGNLSDSSPPQRTAQHAHQITEAATLIKQLRKRPYREVWGTGKEPWGFAGSLGSLQHRSYALNSCTLSIFQSLSMPWPVLLKNLLRKESTDQYQEKSLGSSFAALHELLRWPQHNENDSTAWSFQTLAFAMIWHCWKGAPLFECSDTVCLSSIKTSKNPGTTVTCTTCKSLRGLAFQDRSSAYLSNTLAPEYPQTVPNSVDFRYIWQHRPGLRANWQHLQFLLGHTLAITALQTKFTTGRLSLMRIEDHKEQICRFSFCAWVVWVFRMVQCVPTAVRCPTILFCILTSLACFCRALGCCIRRFITLAISDFICPCPKLQYAWKSFWQFPLATHCTACTPNHWSCNPYQAAPQKAIQGSMRHMQGTMRICWLFG